jgi:glycosyltransferase involved in cell wall biosynthesis
MRLLVVTYDYPRPGAPGANRWALMTKYLRQMGHDVTVITAVSPGTRAGELDGVIRTSDLASNAALRKLLRRPTASGGAATSVAVNVAPPALLTNVIVPDAYLVSWNPWAWRAATRLVREGRVDCLITSSPPESTHLLGFAPALRRAPWIADFRDGWLFDPLREPFPTAAQRALVRRLEQRVATTPDAVVGATEPIAKDLRSRLGSKAEVIYNGFDPDTAEAISPDRPDARKFTLVHTGTVRWGRDPRPLLEAVRRLIDADPGTVDRVEVLFVGMATTQDLELFQDPSLRGVVRYGGSVSRGEAMALQRTAGALLLFTSGRVSEATGKLFEYLASGRPIIALAENNEAARIIEQTGTGVCVPLQDVDAIAHELRRAIDGRLEQSYAPRELDRFSYPGPAERMAAVAARVVAESPKRLR